MGIGQNIKKLREKAGITQAELAQKIGVSQQQIAFYEKGHDLPNVLRIKAMAETFHCTTDELLK